MRTLRSPLPRLASIAALGLFLSAAVVTPVAAQTPDLFHTGNTYRIGKFNYGGGFAATATPGLTGYYGGETRAVNLDYVRGLVTQVYVDFISSTPVPGNPSQEKIQFLLSWWQSSRVPRPWGYTPLFIRELDWGTDAPFTVVSLPTPVTPPNWGVATNWRAHQTVVNGRPTLSLEFRKYGIAAGYTVRKVTYEMTIQHTAAVEIEPLADIVTKCDSGLHTGSVNFIVKVTRTPPAGSTLKVTDTRQNRVLLQTTPATSGDHGVPAAPPAIAFPMGASVVRAEILDGNLSTLR